MDGTLFVFEHNLFNPLTVITVRTCEFDRGCKLLSPMYSVHLLKKNGYDKMRAEIYLLFPKPLSFLTASNGICVIFRSEFNTIYRLNWVLPVRFDPLIGDR